MNLGESQSKNIFVHPRLQPISSIKTIVFGNLYLKSTLSQSKCEFVRQLVSWMVRVRTLRLLRG